MTSLSDLFFNEIRLFEEFLLNTLNERSAEHPEWRKLYESMRYSLKNGGKRFRPALSMITAQVLGKDPKRILPFAVAVEMIHTYSLIHDDLPLLDNDRERRGQPTNHVVFGEPMALLAGDALQSWAFELIATSNDHSHPVATLKALGVLAKASGVDGMVGGQVIDIAILNGAERTIDDLKRMHQMKTGALITAAVEGAAILCEADFEEQRLLREYAQWTGLAFQLSDDILDYEPQYPERSGYPSILGLEATRIALREAVQAARDCLSRLQRDTKVLEQIVEFNLNRER
ncbi:MAG: polyprenyl synthetase family protein [Bdellovibrionales bacterium]|nr:polyprenyl synthetase family protein [Bdellovibrionales bacterium]